MALEWATEEEARLIQKLNAQAAIERLDKKHFGRYLERCSAGPAGWRVPSARSHSR
jgi:hypothetical protein